MSNPVNRNQMLRYQLFNLKLNKAKPVVARAALKDLQYWVREALDMRAKWHVVDVRTQKKYTPLEVCEILGIEYVPAPMEGEPYGVPALQEQK